jgi:hypothetical protein
VRTSPVVWEVCTRLAARHPDLPAGRVVAVVVRTVADLHRISGPARSTTRGADFEQVVEDIADRVLSRVDRVGAAE